MQNPLKNETSRVFALSCGILCIYACIGTSVLIGIVAFAVWNVDQPPKAYHLADSLQEGMSKQEVQQILGAPNKDYEHQFAYTRFMAWGIFYVNFDEDGKLKNYDYDH